MSDERIVHGEDAARLLADPAFRAAMDAIEQSAIEAVLNAQSDEDRRRHSDRANVIRSIRDELASAVAVGSQAEKGPLRVV